MRAVHRGAAAHSQLLEQSFANRALLAGAAVHLVLELKEATDAVSINVIRNGRAAELNRMCEHLLQRGMQPVELIPREPACGATRTDARAEKGFVRIDVAHAMQDRLIEQSSLDRQLAPFEQLGELVGGDSRGLFARAGITFTTFVSKRHNRKPAESARIDETNLALVGECEHGMRMRWQRHIRLRYEQAAR